MFEWDWHIERGMAAGFDRDKDRKKVLWENRTLTRPKKNTRDDGLVDITKTCEANIHGSLRGTSILS